MESNRQITTENYYKKDLQNGLSTMFAQGKKNMDAEF